MQIEPQPVVIISDLHKSYYIEEVSIAVLKNINLVVQEGQFIAIYGPSGAGKTTLLNIISGIDKPTSGEILVFNQNLTKQNEDELSEYRSNKVGFVFQSYNLISTLTVAENIAFPMEWKRTSAEQIQDRVDTLIENFGLQHRANHWTSS